MAAPAVAVLGAIAAVPQVHALAFSPPARAGHQAKDQVTQHRALAHQDNSTPVLNASDAVAIEPGAFRQTIEGMQARQASASEAAQRAQARQRARQRARAAAARTAAAARAAASSGQAGSSGGGAGQQNSGSQQGSSGQQGSTAPSGPATPACTGTGGMLPANYAAIVDFLTAHGYTGIAAAGIAGNIYQESMGNPESVGDGGGGLIGWTPLPAGFVTGNPAADLQTQLAAILTFNQQWAQYIPALNAATSPAQAADIYVTDFERAGIPAFGNREAAAEAVAAACGL